MTKNHPLPFNTSIFICESAADLLRNRVNPSYIFNCSAHQWLQLKDGLNTEGHKQQISFFGGAKTEKRQ